MLKKTDNCNNEESTNDSNNWPGHDRTRMPDQTEFFSNCCTLLDWLRVSSAVQPISINIQYDNVLTRIVN